MLVWGWLGMTDQGVAEGVPDVDATLRHEVAQLVHRFPDVDPDEILRLTRETYACLDQKATIKAYLVTLTVDVNRDLSECVVFRASDVGRGPIARAQLPERIASGTHRCWAPGKSIAGW